LHKRHFFLSFETATFGSQSHYENDEFCHHVIASTAFLQENKDRSMKKYFTGSGQTYMKTKADEDSMSIKASAGIATEDLEIALTSI